MKKLQIATVFSGIGAFEQALNKMNVDYDIVFACDNGEREIKNSEDDIRFFAKKNGYNSEKLNQYVKSLYDSTKKQNMMKKSYFANYHIDENRWYEDIRFIDGKKFKDKVDIFVGGSPCQSFSIIGKRGGLNDTRGTLFFSYANLIKDIQPKVFIYENVPGMLTHDNGNTWEVIQNTFAELGYRIEMRI